eukprot:GHVQ01040293.1.p1 GENE.GHVQ01040293.1~~GHVQ01040293.1.p1  ORF type:complete len:301 (-),score=50.04 GHVQ01040293.1:506-1291(-)
MSNIHRLSDLPPPSTASDTIGGDVKYLEVMLPGYSPKTFIFGVSVVQFIIYICCCAAGHAPTPLSPASWTVQAFGTWGPPVSHGEVWRLLTAVFMHLGIWHILLNIYFQLILGFRIEPSLGPYKFALLYVCCGIFGNLFSTATTSFCNISAGASTSAFGLVGIQVAQLALSWHLIRNKAFEVYRLMLFVLSMILMSAAYKNIDQMGHLGGFLAGCVFGVFYASSMENPPHWYSHAKWCCIVTAPTAVVSCSIGLWAVTRTC